MQKKAKNNVNNEKRTHVGSMGTLSYTMIENI